VGKINYEYIKVRTHCSGTGGDFIKTAVIVMTGGFLIKLFKLPGNNKLS
jgi:hypothetical protein